MFIGLLSEKDIGNKLNIKKILLAFEIMCYTLKSLFSH
jgi:hypothetical protein